MGSENGMLESDPLPLVMTAYFAMVFVMAGLWVVQRRIRNAAVGDVGWCVGLIGSVLWYATQAPVNVERILLTVMLVTLYAGRLAHYILYDRIIGKEEDPRYRRLRKKWGLSEQVNMFAYFQVQAAAVALFSLPFLVVLWNPRPPSSLVELLGLLIWGWRSPVRPRPIGNWPTFAPIHEIRSEFVARASGSTHAIPTIFLNGCTGVPMSS